MVPRAILMKSGLVSLNNARQVNTAHPKITMNSARPMTNLSKSAHSTVKWPIHKNTTFKNNNFNQRVNTVKDTNVNTARPKAVVNAVKGNNVNAVKASACWVWKPKTKVLDHKPKNKVLDHVSKLNSASITLKKFDYVNAQGNMSYLTDYEEIDEGYVAFGGNPKGGKITGRGSGPNRLFDIDALTKSMNYKLVFTGNQSNGNAGTKACDDVVSQSSKNSQDDRSKPSSDDKKKVDEDPRKDSEINDVGGKISIELSDDPNMHALKDYSIFDLSSNDQDNGAEADMNNLDTTIQVSPIPTTRIHKDHPVKKIIRDLNSAPQTKKKTKNLEETWKRLDMETAQTNLLQSIFLLKQENGNSFKPASQTTTNDEGNSTTLIPGLVTAGEKIQKKIDVKARTYGVSTNNIQVSTASTQVSIASTQVSTANLSDATIYAFLANQPNGSQLVYEDLEQIHKDDLEEMDLKWQLVLLSMRTRRFFQKTSRRITINGSDTAGYDKLKVECFNCHKLGHFVRECRGPRNQDSWNWNQDNYRRTVNVEENSFKAILAIDGAGSSNKPEFEGYGHNDLVRMSMKILLMSVIQKKEDQVYVDSGCSRHMIGNMSYLSDFKEFDGGYVTFGGGAKGGRITGKGTLKTGKLDFEDVYFVKELQFNLFTDESQVLLKVPRKNNMYTVDMKNIVLKESLTCLVAKATLDESMLWHRRLGHVNFKTINKLVKDNLVKGLPIKHFENDQTCVACLKGKQHKASFVTDDYSRFTWVFFLASKDETSGILKSFITQIENLVDKKNRVLVVKPHNKTPYELFRGRTPSLSFMRPFGCHVTILNTLDHLGKFDGKSDDRFFVGYSLNSKAFRVYNIRTRKVEENLHVRFLEDKPIIVGDGPKWLFDIDVLIESMNYVPVVAGTNSNDFVGTKESIGACQSSKETRSSQYYILMPLWKYGSLFDSSSKNANNDEPQPSNDVGKKDDEGGIDHQERPKKSAQDVNTAGPSINTASINFNTSSLNINTGSLTVPTALLEAIHDDFFGDETKLNMSNISTTYPVPSTPTTRIHKDNSLDNVIGDV
ncbi:putative ribonuclease H-like domain-containing protein [Tanacetum coccineum]|uniref:Ribonuclease H-like domain-containing protein n=1 Tax=Tanacetum coccineum TaxID=301880 RepID=A0ABQ5IUI8_9ASTR